MRECKVIMPYIANLSVNHYLGRRKGGGYYVKPEVKEWKEQLGWLIKAEHIEEWALPLTVICDGKFKDLRSTPDLSNLSKIILDAIEDVSGVNDRDMRWMDGDVTKSDEEPELLITIREYGTIEL